MIAGLPGAGLSTLYYVALLLGIGATKIWRCGLRVARQIGRRSPAGSQRSRPSHREHPGWVEAARREHRA